MTPHSTIRLNRSQRRVLGLIRRHGPISRAELAEQMTLTAGAISRHCRDLLLMGLIAEQDRRLGGRGQPAVPLVVSGAGGMSIGISLSFNRVEMVALDYAGDILAQQAETLPREDTATLVSLLETLAARLRADLAGQPLRLVGVGLALSGAPDLEGRRVAQLANFQSWIDTSALAAWSLEAWGAPIRIGNNANVAALAEYHAARDPNLKFLVGLNLAYGFGSGFITDGEIFGGAEGMAGAVGVLFPAPLPRPTARDLLVTLRSAGRALETVEDLDRHPPEDDDIVAAWVERVAGQLYPLVRMIWLLLAPQEIVLTGGLPRHTGEALSERIAVAFESEATAPPPPRVLPARLGRLSTAAGAAWLPLAAEVSIGDPDAVDLS